MNKTVLQDIHQNLLSTVNTAVLYMSVLNLLSIEKNCQKSLVHSKNATLQFEGLAKHLDESETTWLIMSYGYLTYKCTV